MTYDIRWSSPPNQLLKYKQVKAPTILFTHTTDKNLPPTRAPRKSKLAVMLVNQHWRHTRWHRGKHNFHLDDPIAAASWTSETRHITADGEVGMYKQKTSSDLVTWIRISSVFVCHFMYSVSICTIWYSKYIFNLSCCCCCYVKYLALIFQSCESMAGVSGWLVENFSATWDVPDPESLVGRFSRILPYPHSVRNLKGSIGFLLCNKMMQKKLMSIQKLVFWNVVIRQQKHHILI